MRFRWSTCAFLLAAFLHASASGADARSESDARVKEARDLAMKGQYDGALAKYVQAYAIDPQPSVLLGMAIVEHQLGRPAAALAHLRRYLKTPDPKTEKELRETLLVELSRSTGHVLVKRPRGTELLVDGKPAGDRAVDDVVDVMPGRHVFAAGGRERDVTVDAGKTVEIDLSPEPPSSSSSTSQSPVSSSSAIIEPPKEQPRERWGTGQWVGGAAFAAGVVALGVGTYFAVARSSSEDAIANLEPFTGPNGERCVSDPGLVQCRQRSEKEDERDTRAGLSTGFFIGGAIAVVAGAVMFLVLPRATTASRASRSVLPFVSPSMQGLVLTW